MKTITVVQARTGSSRLPGKVLLPVYSEPLLVRIIQRIRLAKLTGTIVVATTVLPEDDIVAQLCDKHGIHCFRGHPTDLLDRHYRVASDFRAEAVVKIPSDCPLIDPLVIDQVIGHYISHYPEFDFVSNLHPASYPDGNDVEIFSFEALETAWKHADRDFEREHTTPYIWERPHQFRIGNVVWQEGLDYSTTHRWTIDYQEDYLLINEVYSRLYPGNPGFGIKEILALLEKHPEITDLNKRYIGRYWYQNHLDELTTIDSYISKIVNYENKDYSGK